LQRKKLVKKFNKQRLQWQNAGLERQTGVQHWVGPGQREW